MSYDRHTLANELADAWDTLLRAEREPVTRSVLQGSRYRMAEAVALAVAELDPGHFHDPDPERLHLYEVAGILDEPHRQLVDPEPEHDPSPDHVAATCPRCVWDRALDARERIGARE